MLLAALHGTADGCYLWWGRGMTCCLLTHFFVLFCSVLSVTLYFYLLFLFWVLDAWGGGRLLLKENAVRAVGLYCVGG